MEAWPGSVIEDDLARESEAGLPGMAGTAPTCILATPAYLYRLVPRGVQQVKSEEGSRLRGMCRHPIRPGTSIVFVCFLSFFFFPNG